MKKTQEYATWSLGVEELALALSMINRSDLGRQMLKSVSPGISNEQMDARLTAASHSLAARDLVDIVESKQARLISELEQALLPLVKFDKLIQISKATTGKETFFYTVHIYRKRSFMSHLIKNGVVHVIESGEYAGLVEYLLGKFHEFDTQEAKLSIENGHKVTLGLLGTLMKENGNADSIFQQLERAGLPKDLAARLSIDIADHTSRGSIGTQTVNKTGASKRERYQSGSLILLLAGRQNNWLFEFPKAADNEIAVIHSAGRQALSRALHQFIQP
ncbi:MAG: hypothetical protein AB1554_10285 [Chloroflexota bacterium]